MLCYCNGFTQIPTDSLVAYYPFNGNAKDTSGNGFDGTLNGQTSVSGACEMAYYFNSNNINCGDPAGNEFDLVNDASVSLWMKLLSLPTAGPSSGQSFGYFTLVGKDAGGGNNKKWFFAAHNNTLVFHVNVPSIGGAWAVQTIFNFSPNTFYHLVLTKTGNSYRFYVNSIYYGQQTLTVSIVDVPSAMKIGDLHDGSNNINAIIDEVLIYHKALTQTEINQLYTHCPGMVTSSGSIAQNQPADFKIYPNPSSGKLVLSFANLRTNLMNCAIYNITGVKVFDLHPKLYNQHVTIDLGYLSKGVYLLQAEAGKKIFIRKIVLE
jgi:hypothetical protein